MITYAHAIYCDDIREEVGGKSTHVGVYHGSLLVQSFPVTLPKLCVVLNVVLPADNLPDDLKMQVMLNDSVLAEGEMTVTDLGAVLAAIPADLAPSESSKESGWVVAANFIFAPMQMEGPGVLRASVKAGDQVMKANGLRIGQMKEA